MLDCSLLDITKIIIFACQTTNWSYMKNLFLFLILNVALLCSAQKFEPEFSNSGVMVYGLTTDTISIKLQRTPLSYTSSGAFNTKIHAVAKGNTSNCIVPKDEQFALIVKMKENDEDPQSFIKLIKMDKKKKERKIEIASKSGWTDHIKKGNNIKEVLFDAGKYGISSYILYPSITEPGEYGLLIYNFNDNDERPAQILCFTVE